MALWALRREAPSSTVSVAGAAGAATGAGATGAGATGAGAATGATGAATGAAAGVGVFFVVVFLAGADELDISLMTLPLVISGRIKRGSGV